MNLKLHFLTNLPTTDNLQLYMYIIKIIYIYILLNTLIYLIKRTQGRDIVGFVNLCR